MVGYMGVSIVLYFIIFFNSLLIIKHACNDVFAWHDSNIGTNFFIIESLKHEGFSICERYGSIYLQKESNGIFLTHGFSFMEKAASMF